MLRAGGGLSNDRCLLYWKHSTDTVPIYTRWVTGDHAEIMPRPPLQGPVGFDYETFNPTVVRRLSDVTEDCCKD